MHALSVGVPAQLLQNRPDIRQAERELAAAGLDVKVARANFFPRLVITGGVGYQAFNPKYLFITPEALIDNVAGDLVAPLINKKAIQADYLSANARQLQSRLQLPARHPQRLHRGDQPRVQGGELQQEHRDQEAAVGIARGRGRRRHQAFSESPAPIEYLDVLFAQRDLLDARMVLIDTKQAATVCHRQRLSSPRRRRLFVADSRPETAAISPLVASLKSLQSEQGGRIGSKTASYTGGGGTRSGGDSFTRATKWSGTVSFTDGWKWSGTASNTGGGECSATTSDSGAG